MVQPDKGEVRNWRFLLSKQLKQNRWLTSLAIALNVAAVVSLFSCTPGAVAFSLLVFGSSIWLITAIANDKGKIVTAWALAENEKQRIANLTGSTPAQLKEMVQFHLSEGNLQEADTASQRLIDSFDEV